jgi:signal transduction histidine kinase
MPSFALYLTLVGAAVGGVLFLAAVVAPTRWTPVRRSFALLTAVTTVACLTQFTLVAFGPASPQHDPTVVWASWLVFSVTNALITPVLLLFAYTYAYGVFPRGWPMWTVVGLTAVRLGLVLSRPYAGPNVTSPWPGYAAVLGPLSLLMHNLWAVLALAIVLISAWTRETPGARRQALLLLMAGLVVFAASLFGDYAPGHSPVDLGLATMWVLELAFAVELFRYGLADVLPYSVSAVLDDLSDAVVVVGHDGVVREVNELARTWVPQVAPGVRLNEALPAAQLPADFSEALYEFEVTVEGRELWGRTVALSPRHAARLGAVILLADITERRRAERELVELNGQLAKHLMELEAARAQAEDRSRELADANAMLVDAQQAKDRFLANVSHDLRAPLSTIIGFTDVLLAGLTGELTDEQRRQLAIVGAAGRQLLALVDELLDVARMQEGRLELELADEDVAELLDAVVDNMSTLASEKDVTLVAVPVRGRIVIHTDRRRLLQVLQNLVGNAVKFTAQGYVRISASVEGSSVFIDVEDTGPGISPADLGRIFGRFERANEDTRDAAGVGLGLNIALELAHLLGGDIEVTSTVGEGSRFRVVLPA